MQTPKIATVHELLGGIRRRIPGVLYESWGVITPLRGCRKLPGSDWPENHRGLDRPKQILNSPRTRSPQSARLSASWEPNERRNISAIFTSSACGQNVGQALSIQLVVMNCRSKLFRPVDRLALHYFRSIICQQNSHL